MKKREGAIVSAYTGILIGEFSDFHEYVEELMNRPVQTLEFADKDFIDLLKEKSKEDFKNIKIE